MQYMYVNDVLRYNDKDLFNKVFEKDRFSFNENKTINQLDNFEGFDIDEVIANAKKFGCIIQGRDIIVPAGLCFKSANHKSDQTLLFIQRNEVELPVMYLDYSEEIDVTLTEFGQKLDAYSRNVNTSLTRAYDQLKFIEQLFSVKIVNV